MDYNIVLLYYENGHPTGVIRYIEMLKRGLLTQKKYKIHSIVLDSSAIFPEIYEKKDLIFARLPFEINPYSSDHFWRNKYFNIITKLTKSYLDGKTNIVFHTQEFFLSGLASLLKKELGGTILLHLHVIPWKFSLETNEKTFKQLYKEVEAGNFISISLNNTEQNAYTIADKIICVYNSAKKHILSVCKYNKLNISVIYNGLRETKVTPLKTGNEDFKILFVGRISKEKGIFNLLNALQKVYLRGRKVKLQLAGDCSFRIKNRIYLKYKELDVDFLGNISYKKLSILYSSCSLGIVPSLHEQCSYVAIEMSMFGMPMIVSDVDALSEMFEDEVNALKIPLVFDEDFGLELDEEKLTDAIIRLIDDKVLRQKLSENAIKNYREKFTLDNMIENTINVYEQLIQQDNA
mgnify:FL=1